jgi:hypothetical protein
MGRPRLTGTVQGKAKKLVSDAVHEKYQAIVVLLEQQHRERVHHTRVQLAFERLCREYPRLEQARLWAMAHSMIRMGQGSVHAQYGEQRFIAG